MSSRGSSGIPSVAEEDECDLSLNGADDGAAAAAAAMQSRLRESFDYVYEELESGGGGR